MYRCVQMPDQSAPPTRKNRKRAEIIAIAKNLFFREGYAGASMAQVAATVGGSKATLYSHFKSKEELLLAVIESVIQTSMEEVRSAPDPTDFRAFLQWMGHSALHQLMAPESISMRRLAAAEAFRLPEVGRVIHDSIMAGHKEVSVLFAAAMSLGKLRRADPMTAVEHFMEMLLGWMVRRVD